MLEHLTCAKLLMLTRTSAKINGDLLQVLHYAKMRHKWRISQVNSVY